MPSKTIYQRRGEEKTTIAGGYLLRQGYPMEKYVGFDVLDSMVVKAREVFSASPQCAFTSNYQDLAPVDYAIASGIFNLKLETNVPKGGNSGIFLHAWPEGDPNAGQFVEIQLIDDDAAKFKDLRPNCRNGAIFSLVAPSPVPFAPAELWNTVRLRTQGQRVQVTFNGVQVVDATLPTLLNLRSTVPFPPIYGVTGRTGSAPPGSTSSTPTSGRRRAPGA